MDGKYTKKELNYLLARLRSLESQDRDDAGHRQEIQNLRDEIGWAKNHLDEDIGLY